MYRQIRRFPDAFSHLKQERVIRGSSRGRRPRPRARPRFIRLEVYLRQQYDLFANVLPMPEDTNAGATQTTRK